MPTTILTWPLRESGGGAEVGFTTTAGNGDSATSDSVNTGFGASAGG